MQDVKTFTGKLPESPIKKTEGELQRTEDWFNQRKGRFTGSKIKDLMSCSRSGAGMEWGRPEKIIDLGDTAKKYIFTKAMEKKTGIQVQTPSTAAMKYGTENEGAVKQILGLEVEEVGFIEFIKGIAGASPDGKIKWMQKDAGLEIKCATDWNNFYERIYKDVDQSHLDFWQLQAEMMALKVDKIMYVVAEPSESIFEPNIQNIQKKVVEASEIHQSCIIIRCMLSASIIHEFIKGVPFHDAVRNVCTNHPV